MARDRKTGNVVPLPTSIDTLIAPPWDLTIPCTTANPKPVPLPGSLVVKLGSKIRLSTDDSMPWPVLFWGYFEGNPLKYFMSSESVDSRTELLLSRESL
jgi:hypothetical protein